MRFEQVLFSQGFGTRHECRGLILQERVCVDGQVLNDPDQDLSVYDAMPFSVDGKNWQYFEKAIVALNKPAGYECSKKPIHHPSVMTLLPPPLRCRDVQPVGRLDEDTTGLLILTDDGALQHRLIHPKKHVAKTYEAQCRHPVSEAMIQKLLTGVVLADDDKPVKAQEVKLLPGNVLQLTVTQGKYHQIKRMIAAIGNRCDHLHRTCVGKYRLPDNLPQGQWCFIKKEDLI